jgi:hypothetical protein
VLVILIVFNGAGLMLEESLQYSNSAEAMRKLGMAAILLSGGALAASASFLLVRLRKLGHGSTGVAA